MKLYKPANGTEGEWFFNKFCYRCKNYVEDEESGSLDCKLNLIIAAEINNTTDDDYPDEWRYNEKDKPVCTEFIKE